MQPAVLLILCLGFSACGSQSEKLSKETKQVVSWIASTQMVADEFSRGAVTQAYARDALENFNEELHSSEQRIESLSDSRASQIVTDVRQAEQTISQLAIAVDQHDDLSLAQLNLQLAGTQKTLRSSLTAPITQQP